MAIVGPAVVEGKGKGDDHKPMFVTARKPRPRATFGDAPDTDPEEYRRRGDAAAAPFRKVARRAEEG